MSHLTHAASVDVVLLQRRYLQRRLTRQFAMQHELLQLSMEMAAALKQSGQHQQLLTRWYHIIAPLLE